MGDDTLQIGPTTLAMFIDETGNEDYSDRNNPTFGRAGCAALGRDYQTRIKKPWRRLKRERLGGNTKRFHATEFEQSRPTIPQIQGINRFLQNPFWRFAVMSDIGTQLPAGMDGHKAVSLITIQFIRRLVAAMPDVSTVALVFESSERGNTLVKRDFDLAGMELYNSRGRRLVVDGYFMDKTSMEAGLEVADLIAHTAGRQRRHELAGRDGVTPDFKHMYWHSRIPPAFMSIDSAELTELTPAGLTYAVDGRGQVA